jgi:hypothetical protein
MPNYEFGGTEVPKDASEAIADIPQNRTLMIEKLTADPPIRPDVVGGLKTVEEVFQHFQPRIDVEFQKDDGSFLNEQLSFANLGDFGTKGITGQSSYLKDLEMQKNEYAKLIKQFKSTRLLKAVMENPDSKQAFVKMLEALIQEIDDAD